MQNIISNTGYTSQRCRKAAQFCYIIGTDGQISVLESDFSESSFYLGFFKRTVCSRSVIIVNKKERRRAFCRRDTLVPLAVYTWHARCRKISLNRSFFFSINLLVFFEAKIVLGKISQLQLDWRFWFRKDCLEFSWTFNIIGSPKYFTTTNY